MYSESTDPCWAHINFPSMDYSISEKTFKQGKWAKKGAKPGVLNCPNTFFQLQQ